jgi:hypothetical protein
MTPGELYTKLKGWKITLTNPNTAEIHNEVKDIDIEDFIDILTNEAIKNLKTQSYGSIYGDLVHKDNIPRER